MWEIKPVEVRRINHTPYLFSKPPYPSCTSCVLSVIWVPELSPNHVARKFDWSKEAVAIVAFARLD